MVEPPREGQTAVCEMRSTIHGGSIAALVENTSKAVMCLKSGWCITCSMLGSQAEKLGLLVSNPTETVKFTATFAEGTHHTRPDVFAIDMGGELTTEVAFDERWVGVQFKLDLAPGKTRPAKPETTTRSARDAVISRAPAFATSNSRIVVPLGT